MFDKKYKNAMTILDTEMGFNKGMYERYVTLAQGADVKDAKYYIDKAEEYLNIYMVLDNLKHKITK